MKVRVYHDERKQYKDYIDSWSIVFMTPKRMRKGQYDDRGVFLGCSPSAYSDRINHCTWESIEWYHRIGLNLFLGRKIPLKECPKSIRDYAIKAENIYNAYINDPKNDKKREAWFNF